MNVYIAIYFIGILLLLVTLVIDKDAANPMKQCAEVTRTAETVRSGEYTQRISFIVTWRDGEMQSFTCTE